MDQNFETTAEQAAAFQKIWTESATKMFQAAFTVTPDSPPPEILRQIRSGIFSALAQSWDEFMRSPQFLQAMKGCMEQAINFRNLTTDLMAKVRNDLQAPSTDDTNNVMITVRHMEKRVLDRIEQLSAELSALKEQVQQRPASAKAQTRRRTTRKSTSNRPRKKAA